MIYNAIIERVSLCGCGEEGDLYIDIDGTKLRVYYQAPDEFIMEYLIGDNEYLEHSELVYELLDRKRIIPIDLWLVYGQFTIVDSKEKRFPTDLSVCGGNVFGEVVGFLIEDNYRLDCGMLIDVKDEGTREGLNIGDFIEIKGTYQVFFPDTDWDFA